ncbi:GntR family transcriptional regulator [Tropicimonas sp. IMCC34043]|uniref:GntR family transcriptional regulator n=1 Tax=Tropicimonas sp. IMCC34043 TaxID=2248760 RepID=UPI001E56DFB5|nr:GntR family transcriptional regulator [Tropicimonas sp. IMCC34043]
MNTQEGKKPEHEAIYRRLRDMILFGEVEPGQPVTIMGLTESIGAGMTPVREAIRRLTAEGALSVLGNRRICVPILSVADLEEIRYARLAIEPELAFQAAKNVDSTLIRDLTAIDDQVDLAIKRGNVRTYLEQNHRFHFRLYREARAQVLQALAASLWLRVGPSLRVVCGLYGTSNLPDEHSRAIDALTLGDPLKVRAAMEQDICQGLDQIRSTLPD